MTSLLVLQGCLEKCGFRFFGRASEHAETKPRFLESGAQNLDFSNLGEMFGLFRRAHRKFETIFVNQLSILNSVFQMLSQIFCRTPTGQKAAPALTRPGMLPPGGSILREVDFWEVPIALMLSPGWLTFDLKVNFPPKVNETPLSPFKIPLLSPPPRH